MWTLAEGRPPGGEGEAWFVALIAIVVGVSVLGALAARYVDGRRRRRTRTDYS